VGELNCPNRYTVQRTLPTWIASCSRSWTN
jgi:hypothetical protein